MCAKSVPGVRIPISPPGNFKVVRKNNLFCFHKVDLPAGKLLELMLWGFEPERGQHSFRHVSCRSALKARAGGAPSRSEGAAIPHGGPLAAFFMPRARGIFHVLTPPRPKAARNASRCFSMTKRSSSTPLRSTRSCSTTR